MALRPTLTAAVLLSLAACASDPGGIPQAHCRAAGAEAVLGKTVDEQVIDQAIVGAGAMRSRVIKPGANVTMELDPLRMNLEVDEERPCAPAALRLASPRSATRATSTAAVVTTVLVRFLPVLAHADLGEQGRAQFGDAGHEARDLGCGPSRPRPRAPRTPVRRAPA